MRLQKETLQACDARAIDHAAHRSVTEGHARDRPHGWLILTRHVVKTSSAVITIIIITTIYNTAILFWRLSNMHDA
jgi:hypothetical protein